MVELFIHQWKEKIRSPFWQKSIVLNIVLGVMGLYLALNVVFLSLLADRILAQVYPDRDTIEAVTGWLFYYFSADLIIRFLFQQLPTLSIQPYLTLPIKKSRLLHYLVLKSIPGFFNLFAVLLILPFFVKNIALTQPVSFSIGWIIPVLSLVAVNNFLNFTLKKHFSQKPFVTLLLLAGVGLLIYLDVSRIFSVSGYFSAAVYSLTEHSYGVVVPVALVALSYFMAHAYLKRNAYIEDSQAKSSQKSAALDFLGRYGDIGHLIGVELKLILRNKRPKSLLYVCAFFFLYGFMFYKKENLDNYLIMSFMGLLLPSIFSLNYGQYMFSWESSYFDRVLVSDVTPYTYLKSKHVLLSLSGILGYFIVLPYAVVSYKIAFINAAFLLYNIGVTYMIQLFFSTFNSSYIDLGKSQFMNYQGTGLTHFLVIIPIMGLPFLIYNVHELSGVPGFYFYTIAILGIVGIIFNKTLLQMMVRHFVKRKYKMALGFRQK